MSRFYLTLAATGLGAALMAAGPAQAQIPGLSGNGSGSLGSAASGLLGGSGLPGLGSAVGSSSSGNVAGLLSYCVQNQLLGGAQQGSATTAASSLSQQQGVTSSSAYQQGQSGNLMTAQGQTLSLDSLKGQLKSKVCSMILQHAKSLL